MKDLIRNNKTIILYIKNLMLYRMNTTFIYNTHISKYGLGLGTFIGKTLLEKNYANIFFNNSKKTGGAEVIIKWKNKDLIKV